MGKSKLRQTAKQLTQLLDGILKISTNDYRVVLSDRNGGMIDVYFRDDHLDGISTRTDVTVAFQAIELFAPEGWRIAYHWCTGKHEQFNGKQMAA